MGKSSPSAPAAPDPTKTAAAQTTSNIDTANAQAALNHSNQITPWGSQTWAQGPKNADGTSAWTSTITLDPEQQKLLSSNNQISQLLANLGIQQAGNVAGAINKPVDYNSAPAVQNNPLTSSVAGTKANAGQIQNSIAGAGNIQTGVQNAGQIQTGVQNAGNIQTGVANAGNIQNQLNTSGVPSLVGGDSLSGAMKDNQQAAYKQQSAYLDNSYGQRQKDLENQLIQQGVTQNSDAWNRAMNNLGEQRTFDYNNAFNNSFATGLAANNQLYNQGLSSNQNAFSQAVAGGNFANSAQAQQYGQNANNMALANAAQAQQYGQNANNAQFANSAQAQQYGQNSNNMTQANSAQAQQFGQNAAQGAFGNAAQQQAYGQSSNDANTAFSQGLSNAQLNNQSASQAFQQSLAARNQNLTEQQQAQQTPINLLNALRSGSQVTSPTFGSSPQGNVANTDIAGLYNNQYQGQLAQYNAQQAGNNSLFGSLTGLGGAALLSPAGTFSGLTALLSDRRLKTNIKRVGTHALGIGLYTYDYIWGEPGAGVMADEVEKVMPDAVLMHPSGFKMVNYGML